MIDFCILGSGISGSLIANFLKNKNSVEIFDKSKGVGGRAANRRFKKSLSFDHGAQYFSAEKKEFKNFLTKIFKKKIIKKWNGNHLNFILENKKIKDKYIGKNGNNDISKYLLRSIKKNLNLEIKHISYNGKYWKLEANENKYFYSKNLVITFPHPQAISLSKKFLSKKLKNLKVKMDPNITVMAVFKKNYHLPISSIKFNSNLITWAANENSKNRFKSNFNLWTIQANNTYSKKIINIYKEKKNFYSTKIIKEFIKHTGYNYKDLIYKNIHGWKYAYGASKNNIKSFWSNKYKLGICGDWLSGPKAEDAWESANDLFKKIKKNPLKNKRV